MAGIWHSRTYWRLLGTYGLLVLTSIGLLGSIVLGRAEQHFLLQVEENLKVRATLVRHDVGTGKPIAAEQLQASVEQLGHQIGTRITLVAPDGAVLADSEKDPRKYEIENHASRPEIIAARTQPFGISRQRHSSTVHRDMMYVAARTQDGAAVGFVRVALPLDEINHQLASLRRMVWTTAALTGGAALVLAFWMAKRSTRPLQELTASAARIAAGDYGHKVRAVDHDEFGTLARAFNHMSDRLAVQFAQLEDDRQQLRQLEQVRRDFVANVSHELKTPLSVIKACIETLLDGAADDPEYRSSFLLQIEEQGERLHALILDLLSLARIESGEEVFEFADLPLEEVAVACVERHRARAESKEQLLEAVPPDDGGQLGETAVAAAVTAWADEEAISQILDNLVDNAVKYTPQGGRIRVSWWSEGEHSCLEVADTGIGIPERDLPRIFERFYRVDKARSRELGGTGLGLSIVKHLVQAMHGTVHAYSRPGRGTRFMVRLPRSDSHR
jgi:two-component system phosphate regulon sensor histidine kinase PhoR